MKKPPLGLRPEYIWLQARQQEINEAIQRFNDAGEEVPQEWYEESVRVAEQAIQATLRFNHLLNPDGTVDAAVAEQLGFNKAPPEIREVTISLR